jgi:hypothetical protein
VRVELRWWDPGLGWGRKERVRGEGVKGENGRPSFALLASDAQADDDDDDSKKVRAFSLSSSQSSLLAVRKISWRKDGRTKRRKPCF